MDLKLKLTEVETNLEKIKTVFQQLLGQRDLLINLIKESEEVKKEKNDK